MPNIFVSINEWSSIITALSAIVNIWLAFAIWKTSKALHSVEVNRDFIEQPKVFIWTEGYHLGRGSFVMQNSGRQPFILKSLSIESQGLTVIKFDMENSVKQTSVLCADQEIRDVVITPNKIERFFFTFANKNTGCEFDLLGQLYIGESVRIQLQRPFIGSHEFRIINGNTLKAYKDGKEIRQGI